MIASILVLDRKAIKTLKVTDVYSIHKIVYSLFPGNKRDFLYYDMGGDIRGRKVLILSHSQPLIPDFGSIQSKIVPKEFLNHQYYAFQILINPVQKSLKDKRLIPIISRENLIPWFTEKEKNWGFISDTASLDVYGLGVQIINRSKTKIIHNKAVFRGTMQVSDKIKLKHCFENGIGKGKAFGFGLLQLQPLQIKIKQEENIL